MTLQSQRQFVEGVCAVFLETVLACLLVFAFISFPLPLLCYSGFLMRNLGRGPHTWVSLTRPNQEGRQSCD